MKKLFLTLVLAVMGFTAAMADDATTLVATLSHGGSLKAFYGADAFKSAYDEATDGDVITLSAGRFNTYDFLRKNITIRGLGAWPDANNAMTVLTRGGEVGFYIQDNDNELTVEGIRFLDRVTVSVESGMTEGTCTFSKVYFLNGNSSYNSLGANKEVFLKLNNCATRYNCYIYQGACNNCAFGLYNGSYSSVSSSTSNTPITFQNCVLRGWSSLTELTEDVFTNCLIISNSTSPLDATNLMTICVGFYCGEVKNEADVDFFANVGNSTNKMVADRATFFKDESILIKDITNGVVTSYTVFDDDLNADGTGLYELSDAAKQIYKGNDGTVVGVWGGAYPFNLKTTNPRLTKCEIVPRVDSSGKLSVTIEVAQ